MVAWIRVNKLGGHVNTLVRIAVLSSSSLLVGSAASAERKMTADKQCYLFADEIKFVGEGFAPHTRIDLFTSLNGAPPSSSGDITTGPRGIIEGQTKGPESGSQPTIRDFMIEGRENNDQSKAARVVVKVAVLAVFPEIVGYDNTNGSAELNVQGFIGEPFLYAHYILDGKHFKTVKVGKLEGPCGTLKMKYKKFPFAPKAGMWDIQFDARDNYLARENPYILHQTSVTKK